MLSRCHLSTVCFYSFFSRLEPETANLERQANGCADLLNAPGCSQKADLHDAAVTSSPAQMFDFSVTG